MTEEEAKALPCIGPHPKNTGRPGPILSDGYQIYVCAGSACMAWRWDYFEYARLGYGAAGPIETPKHIHSKEDGFCGLAGKP